MSDLIRKRSIKYMLTYCNVMRSEIYGVVEESKFAVGW